MLASSTSQPSSLANSPPASPSAADEAGAKKKDNLVDAEVRKEASVSFDGGLSLPAPLYDRLFPYQQVGVQWMWELHLQRAGGTLLLCMLHVLDFALDLST